MEPTCAVCLEADPFDYATWLGDGPRRPVICRGCQAPILAAFRALLGDRNGVQRDQYGLTVDWHVASAAFTRAMRGMDRNGMVVSLEAGLQAIYEQRLSLYDEATMEQDQIECPGCGRATDEKYTTCRWCFALLRPELPKSFTDGIDESAAAAAARGERGRTLEEINSEL